MDIILTTALTAGISAVVSSIIAALIAVTKLKGQGVATKAKAFEGGMSILLWREIKRMHSEAVDHGGMNIEERRHLEAVYEFYADLGGNGTGKRLFEEAMELPVLD